MLVRHVRPLGPAIALVLLAATVARADNEKLAEHLRKLNPGALVGGNSIVGTKPKQALHGVHGKPNFIIALGDDETIHGASTNDELGAIGKGVKIVPSNHGHSLIVGGRGSKIVVSGKGHNLIYSHSAGATIILESPGDEVIATGRHDRIVCAEHSSRELIEVAKGVTVSKSCHGHHNQIQGVGAAPAAASASATAHSSSAVFGSGTEEDPFRADCDGGPTNANVCAVNSFPARTLPGLWSNEHVPAYKCPGDSPIDAFGEHPYLLNHNYAPAGTTLPRGVEVEGLGPIGVSITATLIRPPYFDRAEGTQTGVHSSATNWTTTGPKSYRVILHCTDQFADGY